MATATLGDVTPYPLAIDERAGRAFIFTAPPHSASASAIRLYMFDTTTGARLRAIQLLQGPMVVDARTARLFVATPDRLWTLDARTLSRLSWTRLLTGWHSLAVDAPARRVYAFSDADQLCAQAVCPRPDARVQVFDAENGRPLRAIALRDHGGAGIAVDPRAHRLLVASADPSGSTGALTTLDTRDDRLLRRVTLTPPPIVAPGFAPLVDPDAGRAYLIASAHAAGWFSTTMLPPVPRDVIDVVDTRTGAPVRAVHPAPGPAAVAAPAGAGRFAVAIFGPARYVIAPATWGGSLIRLSPTGAGRIELRAARNGSLLGAIPAGGGVSRPIADARHGRIYALSRGRTDPATGIEGADALTVIDEASGRVTRTIRFDAPIEGSGLDAARDRLLLVDTGATVVRQDPWGWIPRGLRKRLPFLPRSAPSTRQLPARLTILDTGRL